MEGFTYADCAKDGSVVVFSETLVPGVFKDDCPDVRETNFRLGGGVEHGDVLFDDMGFEVVSHIGVFMEVDAG